MPTLHALLTAVNQYHPLSGGSVSNLHGCKNDILGLQAFLEDHFPKEHRNIATLTDGDATYANVVRLFGDELLGRAEKGDIVLFAYSGHGSQEQAAREFDRYYPAGWEETLVLHDSRNPGGLDLADKELALLIERLALKDAHVVVLLDCCHAGSGTRNIADLTLGAARQTTGRSGRRPLDSYLDGAYAQKGQGFYLPNSRHILLAACDRSEKAYETTAPHGLFTSSLLKVLEETGGRLSYADLFTRCRTAVLRTTDRQHPQFEPSGFFNAYQGFLGLGEASQGAPLRIFFENEKWQANMGALHGLSALTRPAAFEVLKDGQPLGALQSRIIGMEQSTLAQPDFDLDPDTTYEARLTSLPAPKAAYGLKGSPAKVQEALQALASFNPLYFGLREDAANPACYMEVDEDQIRLFRTADGLRLRTIAGDQWDKMFFDAFDKLERIARWEQWAGLDNKDTRIDKNEVELVLMELDAEGRVLRETSSGEAVVDILLLQGKEQPVPFRLEVRNKSGQKTRHCALFYASSGYGFESMGYNEPVLPGAKAVALERNESGIPLAFKLKGKPEETDIFKLFVSNTRIGGASLGQEGFELGEEVRYWKLKNATPETLLHQGKGIFPFDDDEEEEDLNDWFAITLRVKCVAQEAGVGERPISLSNGFVKISPHPAFRAGVSVASASAAARSIEPMAVIADMAARAGVELVSLQQTTRGVSPLNMLELTGLENEDALQDQPLELEIAAQLGESDESQDMLLPLTFDGEHLLPVGEVSRLENGSALVRISSLPDTTDARRRSLGKALKLCFLKMVLKKKQVQFLQWADYSGEKAVRRPERLREKVAASQRILLLLHGIIGDTAEMAESMRRAQAQGLAGLVLTFDYENLNTPIERTAEALARMLRDAGLDSSKHLTILAHSMGGLVSRYFIENLGGKELVKHLILAGTPSGGSSIARITTYRDYAIPLLTLLVNTPWGIPAAATALGVLEKSKDLTVTLAQMDYEHGDFLQNLNLNADPGIPYHIVAGNLERFLGKNQDKKSLMDKAYRLGGKLFYGDQPNDIAVSIDSIKAVPADRTPQPEAAEVDCHHLNYFTEPESMEVLMKFLGQGA